MDKKDRIKGLLDTYGRDCAVFIVSVSGLSVSGQDGNYTDPKEEYLGEILQHFFEQKGRIEKVSEEESIVLIPEQWDAVKCGRYSRCLKDSMEYLLSLKGIRGRCVVETYSH